MRKTMDSRTHAIADHRAVRPEKDGILLTYFFFAISGVAAGSFYAAGAGTESLLYRLMAAQLSLVPDRSLAVLLRERGLLLLVTAACLYIAGRSLVGRFLVPPVLILSGLSAGLLITYLLAQLGLHAFGFLLSAVILPKTLSLPVLLLLCRWSFLKSESLCGRRKDGKEETGTFILLTVVYLLIFLLEQVLLKKAILLIL